MRRSHVALIGVVLLTGPAAIDAHFKLLEPASWLVSSDRGDPQKAAPCGGDAKDKGTPSNIVGKAVGGQQVRVRVQETVYHPGHYRVALAVNSRDELPADPVTTTRETEKGPRSIWAVVQSPPQKPVLADGLFPHYTRPSQPQTVRSGYSVAEYQLQEMHAADRSVDGRAWLQQPRRIYVSPLRGSGDHGGSGEAARRGMARRRSTEPPLRIGS